MKKIIAPLLFAGLSALMLGGCTGAQVGSAAGGAAGAGIGYAATGGSAVGTIIGAGAGALVGNAIGREQDRRYYYRSGYYGPYSRPYYYY
ncbi:TPA: glycine zipper domain-containing protein [Legionella anisa]